MTIAIGYYKIIRKNEIYKYNIQQMSLRDVSAGATGATAFAPKFSDTLTLSPPAGRFFLPLQRLHLTFPRSYVPVLR